MSRIMYILSELKLKVNYRKNRCLSFLSFWILFPYNSNLAEIQLYVFVYYMIWVSYEYIINNSKFFNHLQYALRNLNFFFLKRIETQFCKESSLLYCYWSVSKSWLDSSTKHIIIWKKNVNKYQFMINLDVQI